MQNFIIWVIFKDQGVGVIPNVWYFWKALNVLFKGHAWVSGEYNTHLVLKLFQKSNMLVQLTLKRKSNYPKIYI